MPQRQAKEGFRSGPFSTLGTVLIRWTLSAARESTPKAFWLGDPSDLGLKIGTLWRASTLVSTEGTSTCTRTALAGVLFFGCPVSAAIPTSRRQRA